MSGSCRWPQFVDPNEVLFAAAEQALRRVIAEMSDDEKAKPNRTGGRFTIAISTQERLLIYGPVKLGELTEERDQTVSYFSMEKAMRLHLHPDHQTSRESRDEAAKQYAGAKRFGDVYILSFSGFSEEDDEKMCRYTVQELEREA